MLLAGVATAARGQWVLDGFDPNANDQVRSVVVQPDGKILIGGYFTSVAPNGGAAVTRNHIARFNPDGTLDIQFDPNTDNTVFCITLQPDGKILIGGAFTSLSPNGGAANTRNRIARLNSDGTLDGDFNPNANSSVFAIAVQSDGKIVAGGYFNGTNSIGGQARNNIARLDAITGSADSFDPHSLSGIGSGPGPVFTVAIQRDGKIVAGGSFRQIGGQVRRFLARLDPATGLADSFNPNADEAVLSIAAQADGKILVGGNFASVGGQPRLHLARLDSATGLADSFDPNPTPSSGFQGVAIAVQADGKILVGSQYTSIGGQPRNRIARLDSNGLADSFDPNANDLVEAIAIQADGKVLLVGIFTTVSGQVRNRVARVAPPQVQITSVTPLTNGHVVLQCLGAPNQVNNLQASPDLRAGSFTPVSPAPPVADATGAFEYDDDVNALGLTKRFYRLVSSETHTPLGRPGASEVRGRALSR